MVPFSGMMDWLAIMKILEGGRPQKPRDAENLGFTNELWSMVERCWRENRGERPNVGEILRCLESAVPAWNTRPQDPQAG